MPWLYEQNTGRLLSPNGRLLAVGYSGAAAGKNNPDLQEHHALGPIPRGLWKIRPALAHPRFQPPALPLSPCQSTNTHGRIDFWIHGDLPDHQQDASHGCIVLPHFARAILASSKDTQLIVALAVPDPTPPQTP